jgi:hypothetical protein
MVRAMKCGRVEGDGNRAASHNDDYDYDRVGIFTITTIISHVNI